MPSPWVLASNDHNPPFAMFCGRLDRCLLWAELCRSRAMLEGRCRVQTCRPLRQGDSWVTKVPAAKALKVWTMTFPLFLLRPRCRFHAFDRRASSPAAQWWVDHSERQSHGRNSEANPQEAHRCLHRPRDEDEPLMKTAGRRDDRKARGFPNQGRPEKERPRNPRDRRRAAGAQLKCRADGVRS